MNPRALKHLLCTQILHLQCISAPSAISFRTVLPNKRIAAVLLVDVVVVLDRCDVIVCFGAKFDGRALW